jgi:hypothetical protein
MNDSDTAELMELAGMAREPGWWLQYANLNHDPYIGLEQEATSIICFSMYYVPALLQTGAYAREIIRAIARKMDPKVHEQRVGARLRRQQLLEQDNRPRYRALLDEAVLRRRVGGPTVMANQLDKVLKLERESDLDRYREAVEYLRDEVLSPRDSVGLMAEIQKDYAGEH